MTRSRHRTIAAIRAMAHLQPPCAAQTEIERGALIDFVLGCAIAGIWAFCMWTWAL